MQAQVADRIELFTPLKWMKRIKGRSEKNSRRSFYELKLPRLIGRGPTSNHAYKFTTHAWYQPLSRGGGKREDRKKMR